LLLAIHGALIESIKTDPDLEFWLQAEQEFQEAEDLAKKYDSGGDG
jgi:hypothetical protein